MRAAKGKKWSSFAQGTLILNVLGAAIGMCVIVKGIIQNVHEVLFPDVTTVAMNEKFLIAMLLVLLVLPMSLMAKTSALRFTSIFAFIWVCFLSGVLVTWFAAHGAHDVRTKDLKFFQIDKVCASFARCVVQHRRHSCAPCVLFFII